MSIAIGLQALGAGFQGGDAGAVVKRYRDQLESMERKQRVGSLLERMDISGPQRAILETMPAEQVPGMLWQMQQQQEAQRRAAGAAAANERQKAEELRRRQEFFSGVMGGQQPSPYSTGVPVNEMPMSNVRPSFAPGMSSAPQVGVAGSMFRSGDPRMMDSGLTPPPPTGAAPPTSPAGAAPDGFSFGQAAQPTPQPTRGREAIRRGMEQAAMVYGVDSPEYKSLEAIYELREPEAPVDREYTKAPDGNLRYIDDGSLVFPNVEQDVQNMDVEGETNLRKEFTSLPIVKNFQEQSQAFGRIVSSADQASPAGDLALIFNYMKVLDPQSVVRESEFATAAKAGSYGDRIAALVGQVEKGTKLSDPQREDFVKRAEMLYNQGRKQYEGVRDEYMGIAGEYGLDSGRTAPDFTFKGIAPRTSQRPLARPDPMQGPPMPAPGAPPPPQPSLPPSTQGRTTGEGLPPVEAVAAAIEQLSPAELAVFERMKGPNAAKNRLEFLRRKGLLE